MAEIIVGVGLIAFVLVVCIWHACTVKKGYTVDDDELLMLAYSEGYRGWRLAWLKEQQAENKEVTK